jgi:hypothetical protein
MAINAMMARITRGLSRRWRSMGRCASHPNPQSGRAVAKAKPRMNKVPAPEPKLALAVAAAHTAGQGRSPFPRPRTADRTGQDHLAATGHHGRAALRWDAVLHRGRSGRMARTKRYIPAAPASREVKGVQSRITPTSKKLTAK